MLFSNFLLTDLSHMHWFAFLIKYNLMLQNVDVKGTYMMMCCNEIYIFYIACLLTVLVWIRTKCIVMYEFKSRTAECFQLFTSVTLMFIRKQLHCFLTPRFKGCSPPLSLLNVELKAKHWLSWSYLLSIY